MRSVSTVVLLVVLAIPLLAPLARGEDAVAPVATGTIGSVLDLAKKEQLRGALRLTGDTSGLGSAATPAARKLGLLHASLRAACFSADRQDDENEVRRVLGLAGDRVRPEDLPLLRALADASSRAAPYARALARRGYARIDASLPPQDLLALLKGDDGEARQRALVATGDRLARLRATVDAGGELDATEQGELADPGLMGALIDSLTWGNTGVDLLPHDLGAQVRPSPLNALALIEAPAIPVLESAVRRSVPGADAALTAVRQAALARVRRYPRSTWSSASGTLPSIVPGALACAACKHLLPEGARFCPTCSAAAPGVPCARCGQIAQGDICARCGGVTGSAARAAVPSIEAAVCDKCGEHQGANDRFCRRCGARREDTKPR